MRRVSVLFAVLVIAMAANAAADIIPGINPITQGNGIGTVNTVLTIQANGTEAGCVGWSGTVDIIGAGCPAGIVGGNEKTGNSQTQTRSIAQLGLTNAQALRIVVNPVEPSGDSIRLDKLVLTIFDANNGTALFQGALASPINFPDSNVGTGAAGFLFQLDAPQAAAAQLAGFGNPANRIGIAAAFSDTAGGNETIYVANDTSAVPTMGTWLLMTLGVLLVGTAWMAMRRRRQLSVA